MNVFHAVSEWFLENFGMQPTEHFFAIASDLAAIPPDPVPALIENIRWKPGRGKFSGYDGIAYKENNDFHITGEFRLSFFFRTVTNRNKPT